MTSFRTAIPDFQTANPLYVGATVFFYEADASGNKTSTLATLYAGPIGSLTVSNPQTLDSDGKFVRPVYIDRAVIGEIVGPTVGGHDTGIIQAFINGNWRGAWTTATLYIRNDFVLSDDGFSIYVASQNFTSSGTLAQDISDGNLAILLDFDDFKQEFEKTYLGAKASDPTLDNEGNALINGALYFNTSDGSLRFYDGTSWTKVVTPNASEIPYDNATSGLTATDVQAAFDETAAEIGFKSRVDVASAATANIGAAGQRDVRITGTTTITAFDTVGEGIYREVLFGGALTLTHNATSLILPGGANITTAAGDTALLRSEGSGNWRCVRYARASGRALVRPTIYESAETAYAAGSIYTFSHGLGRRPEEVQVWAACVTNQIGVANVGDWVLATAPDIDNGGSSRGVAVRMNTTDVFVHVANDGLLTINTSGVATTLTTANFRLVVRAR